MHEDAIIPFANGALDSLDHAALEDGPMYTASARTERGARCD